jgi:hypothetical protein
MAIELQTGIVGHADRTDARPNSTRYKTVIKADTYESLMVQLTEEVNKGRLVLDGRKYLRIKKGNNIVNI